MAHRLIPHPSVVAILPATAGLLRPQTSRLRSSLSISARSGRGRVVSTSPTQRHRRQHSTGTQRTTLGRSPRISAVGLRQWLWPRGRLLQQLVLALQVLVLVLALRVRRRWQRRRRLLLLQLLLLAAALEWLPGATIMQSIS